MRPNALASLRLLAALLCIAALSPVAAQENRFPFHEGDTLAGAVPSPDEFHGTPLGSRFTPHHEMLTYYRALAAASDRVAIRPYGRTAEGRELVLVFVGSAETIARLDEIESLQGELADPRRREAETLDDLLPRLPAVLWLSYNVHGNEASASEAALWTVYQLVDGADDASQKIRENALVIVDPCLNPDGRDRYSTWYHQVAQAGGNPDPNSLEHREPWPGGRANHYLFDLNRDWAWQSQPETRARIVPYLRWQPLVHVDFHEMSPESTYFFFPATDPINTNVAESTLAWGETIGRENARAFDRFGWLYYTGESFDLFYPSYGDSWPSLHGAIGMTYEQAGSGRGGLRYIRRDGTLLTLSDRLHHHHVAGMATLLASVERKADLQADFHAFRRSAIEVGRAGDLTEFLFPPGQGERLERMTALLAAQGIEVSTLATEVAAESLTDYHGVSHEVVKLPAGTVSVRLAQPAGRLARALLEPRAEVTDAYFYDVSAWSLPLAMGVRGYHTGVNLEAERSDALPTAPEGAVDGTAEYAYLLPWEGTRAARALARLHERGFPVRLVPDEIEIEGRTFARGTIVVPVRTEGVHEAVRGIATECHVVFHAVDTGWTDEGIDLGSDRVSDLRAPRIAVASGEGVSSLSYGAIWSLFEQELGIAFSALAVERIAGPDLDDYDVLVLPSGVRSSVLDEDGVDRLRDWVRGGGTIIGLGRSAFALADEGAKLSRRKSRLDDPPREDDEEDAEPERKLISDLRDEREERQVPGNIFRVELDPEHPLAFGQPERIDVFLSGTRTFALAGDGGDVAAFTGEPSVSGFISEENIDKVRGRVYLAEESLGAGHVVLFAGDPNFRGFWHGLTGLFLNAVYLRSTH